MKKYLSLKNIITPVLIISAIMCISFFGYSCMLPGNSNRTNSDEYGFDELFDLLGERYIGDFDTEELVTNAKRALIDSLDDNWSYYMTAEEYQQYLQSSDNTYHGIGVEVEVLGEEHEIGGMKVTNVYNNSGAQEAGIVIGDIITEVDGTSIRGYTIVDIRAVLRRQLGETALITVYRENGEYEELTVTYSAIFQDPVAYEMLTGNIGYIKLSDFEGGSAESFISAAAELIDSGAKAFIFDVRSNYGGRVVEMTAILDFLLPEGIIFIAVDRQGNEQITRSDADFVDLPAVVLVNSHSYSGAEYFTAALSEYNYAFTVGEPTTGKNRMQTTLPLSDGSALHISTGMFLTPNHIDLYEQGGYVPDYVIEFSDEELELFYRRELSLDDDRQIQKALELLR